MAPEEDCVAFAHFNPETDPGPKIPTSFSAEHGFKVANLPLEDIGINTLDKKLVDVNCNERHNYMCYIHLNMNDEKLKINSIDNLNGVGENDLQEFLSQSDSSYFTFCCDNAVAYTSLHWPTCILGPIEKKWKVA